MFVAFSGFAGRPTFPSLPLATSVAMQTRQKVKRQKDDRLGVGQWSHLLAMGAWGEVRPVRLAVALIVGEDAS